MSAAPPLTLSVTTTLRACAPTTARLPAHLASSPESLLAAFCDGDARAFEALYRRLAPRVLGLLRVLCCDPRAAEDLAQLVFLKVLRARDTWKRGAAVEPWVLAIARNTFFDEQRARRRRREQLSEEGELPEPALEQAPPYAEAPEDARAARLRAALAALPEKQREAVVLLKFRGLSVQDAALVAGTTQGALKLRAHRGYEALRRDLRPEAPRTAAP